MTNEKTHNLAERIAALLQENEKGSDDFAFVRASLEKINERLDKIESQIVPVNHNSQIPTSNSFHPSVQKFENLDESTHNRQINSIQNEKACPYEPAGKPCDHCAMCSARGF